MDAAVVQGGGKLVWNVQGKDGSHKVEFAHGTTTGSRVIVVDGKEIFRKNFMFMLVGQEVFKIGPHTGVIDIYPCGLKYSYKLTIDGVPSTEFSENRRRVAQCWTLTLDGQHHLIVLDKGNMEIWVDGDRCNAQPEFVDCGTETPFQLGRHSAYVLTSTGEGGKRDKITHRLFVDDVEVDAATEARD